MTTALLTITDGHYLNLPVMNETGEIVGMVDVLKLTYATLEQVNSMNAGDQEGPAWNKFWLSMDNDTESIMSGEGSHRPATPGHRSAMDSDMRVGVERGDSVMPHDSASHTGEDAHSDLIPQSPAEPPENIPFPFKFKAPSGRVHRLQIIASDGVAELVASVTAKLGAEIEAVGGEATVTEGKLGKEGYALSYMDNEGDTVSITTDQDLVEAISLARKAHRDKVDLFVHDPSQPAIPITLEPRPQLSKPPTPPESTMKEAGEAAESSDEEVVAKPKSRKQAIAQKEEQIISGVPNDLLLPGAIAGLAVVIVAVFALSRSSKP